MSELLSEFKSEAVPSLLFLKNVESIELFDWASDASAPTRLFTCELQNGGPDVHRHRQVSGPRKEFMFCEYVITWMYEGTKSLWLLVKDRLVLIT